MLTGIEDYEDPTPALYEEESLFVLDSFQKGRTSPASTIDMGMNDRTSIMEENTQVQIY